MALTEAAAELQAVLEAACSALQAQEEARLQDAVRVGVGGRSQTSPVPALPAAARRQTNAAPPAPPSPSSPLPLLRTSSWRARGCATWPRPC